LLVNSIDFHTVVKEIQEQRLFTIRAFVIN
jgi:hypothetical protein